MTGPAPPIPPRLQLVLLLLLALGGWQWWQGQATRQRAAGRLHLAASVEVQRIQVASRISGRVQAIPVAEGMQVTRGSTVMELANPALAEQVGIIAAQRDQAEAAYAELARGARAEELLRVRAAVQAAREQVRLLEAGARPQEREAARIRLELAQSVQAQAEREEARAHELFARGVIARQELEAIALALSQAQDGVRLAQEQLAQVESGARGEEIAIAQARVREQEAVLALLEAGPTAEALDRAAAAIRLAEAQRAQLEAELGELVLAAPVDAYVDRLLVEPGEVVLPGQAVLTLRNPAEVRLRAYLPEPELSRVRLGQGVLVQTAGAPDLAATILTIASEAEFTPRNIQTPDERATQVFAMDLRVSDPPDWLRDGMTVTVVIERQEPDRSPT